jgi:hypothetical protein
MRYRRCPIASSTLSPKIQRKSMLPAICPKDPCMNMLVKMVGSAPARSTKRFRGVRYQRSSSCTAPASRAGSWSTNTTMLAAMMP